MSRFADWRARRRSTSRRTAPTVHSRPGSNGAARPTTLAPATGSHLSDGVVVQTHLVARLLGLRILRVEGVVHLAPARLEPIDAVPAGTARAARTALGPPVTLGTGLAHASELIQDGDRRLH
jgi:hypothetical protein